MFFWHTGLLVSR